MGVPNIFILSPILEPSRTPELIRGCNMKRTNQKRRLTSALLRMALSSGLMLALTACSDSKTQAAAGDASVENTQFAGGVLGGNNVQTGSRVSRSVVALYAQGFGLCTGTLISNNAVLTAAHCIPQSSVARLQVVFATSLKGATAQQVRAVTRMYVHPWYNQRKNQSKNTGDIALVKFQGGLPAGYSPVGLLPYNSLVADRSIILISGYGNNDGVNSTGSGVLRDTISLITNARYSETEVEVSQLDGRGSCNGDSGGPSFITYGGAYYVWGVVSRGDQKCQISGIYTNALAYRSWIDEKLQAL